MSTELLTSSRRFLVINADDLGYNRERDNGIFKCFLEDQSVTSASVLANGIFGHEALERALKIDLPVGLHFNITEGKPLVESENIQSLLRDGVFMDKYKFVDAAKHGLIDKEEVKLELQAQISWFRRISGSLPVHIDGHQHVHVLPTVREAFCEVLNKHNIKWTRLPMEKDINTNNLQPYKDFLEYIVHTSKESRDIFSKFDIQFTQNFIGCSTMGSNMSKEKLLDLLSKVFSETGEKCITCELMVHPGYVCFSEGGCGNGPDQFSKSKDREHEMRTLRDPSFKKSLNDMKIELKSFKDLEP